MNRWDAIVFDLDDTLYPEIDYVLSGFHAAAEWAKVHLGLPSKNGFRELKSLFDRNIRGDTFDTWLRMHGIRDKKRVEELVNIYRGHSPSLNVFPEVLPLLEFLGQHCRLGIVSDGYCEVQARKLKALGIAAFFQAIVFSDELGREAWKPSVVPFKLVLSKLGTEARRSVYVGDNPLKDFFGARQIGMFTVQLQQQRGGEYATRKPPSSEYAPDRTIASLNELKTVLGLV